jgi:hypothetical protein
MPLTAASGVGWTYSDGGRRRAGYKGYAGDCVARAIALAFDQPNDYRTIYNYLARGQQARGRKRSARNGVASATSAPFLKAHGAVHTDLLDGETFYKAKKTGRALTLRPLRPENFPELMNGSFIICFERHFAAMREGVIFDTHDPTIDYRYNRRSLRPVLGYWDCTSTLPIEPGGVWAKSYLTERGGAYEHVFATNQRPKRQRASRD